MKYKIFFVLLLFLKASFSFAQGEVINLPLTKNTGVGPFKNGFRATILDSTFLSKGIPSEITDYIIKYVDFDFPLAGEIDKSISRIHFLVGFKSDSITIIVDQNFNLSFLDDSIFLYPKEKEIEKELPHIDLKMKYMDKEFIYTFQPYPYKTNFEYTTRLEGIHYLMIKQFEYKCSNTLFNDSPIYVFNSRPGPFIIYEQSVKISLKNSKTDFEFYSLGDSFLHGDYRYLIKNINKMGDTLSLIKTLIDSIQTGFTTGLTLEPIQVKNIEGNYMSFPGKKGFTLIDFWGTWCGPCLELTPHLKNIYKNYSHLLDIISIAYDNDSMKAMEYIKENQMTWNHIIESESTIEKNGTIL